MIERKCTPKLIAGSDACEVCGCEDCGTVHLNIGPVSMRLKQAHFMKVVETLVEVMDHLNLLHSEIKLKQYLNRGKLHH